MRYPAPGLRRIRDNGTSTQEVLLEHHLSYSGGHEGLDLGARGS